MALKLALDGYDVVCCTTSDERFESIRGELKTLCSSDNNPDGLPKNRGGEIKGGPGRLLRARRLDEGVHHRFWVVGKYETSVR